MITRVAALSDQEKKHVPLDRCFSTLMIRAGCLWAVLSSQPWGIIAFQPLPVPRSPSITTPVTKSWRSVPPLPHVSTTQLPMVFDFFRRRTQEGLDQLSNIADAASRGELGRGLADAAAYTAESNRAFANGLAKSRNRLLQGIEYLLTGVNPEEMLDELQDILLQADLGTRTAEDIVNEVRSLRESSTSRLSGDDLKSILRGKILEALDTERSSAITFSTRAGIPTVLFIMGANGMGKTTTIGKLAHRLRTEGNQTVVMAACDTFRAGAVEQLQQWAERAQVPMVGPTETAKTPSAVLYAALDKAVSEEFDTLLVDTSGRLSNNDALTQELLKMKRVIQKRLSVESDEEGKPKPNLDVPHETLLVVDAAQGRMALDSARTWNEEIGLTGLILTKLDGSARGGSVVAVSRDLQLPVKLIGVGEGIEDLRDFEAERFVDSLLGIGAAGGSSSANEGLKLQARLDQLRKERAIRASTRKGTGTVGVRSTVTPMAQVDTMDKPPLASPKSKRGKKRKIR